MFNINTEENKMSCCVLRRVRDFGNVSRQSLCSMYFYLDKRKPTISHNILALALEFKKLHSYLRNGQYLSKMQLKERSLRYSI